MFTTMSPSSSSSIMRRHHGHALAAIVTAILLSSSSFATLAALLSDVNETAESLGAPLASTTETVTRQLTSHERHILQRAAMEAALCRLGDENDDCSSRTAFTNNDECGAKDSDGQGQCNDSRRSMTQQLELFESIREKRAYYYFHSGLVMHAQRAWQMAGQQHHADDNSKDDEREYLVTGLGAKLDLIRTQLKQDELLLMKSNNSHATVDDSGGNNRVDDSHYTEEVVKEDNNYATSTITTIHTSSSSSNAHSNDNNNIRKMYQSQLEKCRNYQLHLFNDNATDVVDDSNSVVDVVDVYNVNSPSEIIERRYYNTILSQEEENNDSDHDDEIDSSDKSNPNIYVKYYDSSSSTSMQEQSSSSSSTKTSSIIDSHYHLQQSNKYYYYGLVAKRDYTIGEIVYTNIHNRRHHYHQKRKTDVLYFQDGIEWIQFINSFIDDNTTTTATTTATTSDYDSIDNEGMEDNDDSNTANTPSSSSLQHSLACLIVESSLVKRISKPGRYVIIVDIDMGLYARRTRRVVESNVVLADKLDRFDWLAIRNIKAGEEIVVPFFDTDDGIKKKVEYDYYTNDEDNDDDDEGEEEQEEDEGGVATDEEVACISTPNICGCDKVKQIDYRGNISITENGRTCQKWDEQSPNVHYWISTDYPNADIYDNNYCRSPDGEWPWCITTDTNVLWEYCDIPSCPTTTTTTTTIVTNQQSNPSSIITEGNINNTTDEDGDSNRNDEEDEEEGGDEINVQL
jgi:hypothetical protein